MVVEPAQDADVNAVVGLMREYCRFYEVPQPAEEGLREMATALIAAPDHEGMLLVARGDDDSPVGFAALGWKWSSLRGARIVVLEDLFVAPHARGRGAADALILEAAGRARAHGAPAMIWVTALDNHRAQAVYERVGATGSRWLEYELELKDALQRP